ncbi:MAG: 4'-phosphopantetheinyl transferase superfamily protein [Firmicutes bacterium]|nr:4'-phosphopantetheinyl transferase superfamily protein [Bacillota bacterium]
MKGSELTDVLIKDCLEEYGVQDPQILRTTKGKPYVELCDTYLSVSHSGEYFLCIIAERPVGIDVQERKNSNSDKIAERYFTEREKSFIRDNGENGFFTVWTRKEAYSKLTGEGIAEIIRGTEVIGREDVVFTDFQLEDGVWCSYCIER